MPTKTSTIILASAIAVATLLTGCKGSSGPGASTLAEVSAADGGSFSDSGAHPNITIVIPPDALDRDAVLTVTRTTGAGDPGPNQVFVRGAFSVSLVGADGQPVTLGQPMKVALRTDAPMHPQIAEIARRGNDRDWTRLDANFYRPDSGMVVALTQETSGSYRAIHRSLQLADGDGVARGAEVMLYETFGNEAFFGAIGLQEVLNNVTPADAVALGAQVDLAQVPQGIVDVMLSDDFAAKQAALGDPAVTRALIKAGAVVGVVGQYADPSSDVMTGVGLTCALCHVNVETNDFELEAGVTTPLPIGALRMDGVPNVAIDAGAILAFTPFAQSAGQPVIDLLNSWGPGRFDIRALPDNPLDDGVNNPTKNPPIWNFIDLETQDYAFGFDGLFKGTNALASQAEAVYDLVMHGNGAFGTDIGTLSPALAATPPQALLDALLQAEADQPGNVITEQELLDLQTWMRSIASPAPAGFDVELAEQGFELFFGKANCAECHSSPEFTGPGNFADITDPGPSGDLLLLGGVKVPGLRGVSQAGIYFHDGSASTLDEVVARFVERGKQVPTLTPAEQTALVEYLKSL